MKVYKRKQWNNLLQLAWHNASTIKAETKLIAHSAVPEPDCWLTVTSSEGCPQVLTIWAGKIAAGTQPTGTGERPASESLLVYDRPLLASTKTWLTSGTHSWGKSQKN